MTDTAKLKSFLISLSENQDLSQKFRSSPVDTMKEEGLDEESIQAISSGDATRLRQMMASSDEVMGEIVVVIVLH